MCDTVLKRIIFSNWVDIFRALITLFKYSMDTIKLVRYFSSAFRLVYSLSFFFLCSSSIAGSEPYQHDGFMFRFFTGYGYNFIENKFPVKDAKTFKSDGHAFHAEAQFGRAATTDFIIYFSGFYTYLAPRDTKAKDFIPLAVASDSMEELSFQAPSFYPNNVSFEEEIFTYGFGIGCVYYTFWNMYLSAQWRVAVFSMMNGNIDAETFSTLSQANPNNSTEFTGRAKNLFRSELEGQGISVKIGKEFWLASELGIGLAVYYNIDWLNYSKHKTRSGGTGDYVKVIRDDLSRGSMQQMLVGFVVSLTYN